MNDDPMYRGPILNLYTIDDHIYCYLPSDIAWPTMLGLLTIISDAIAAAPWWGDGEGGVELPAVGSVWVARPGRSLASPHVVVTHVEPPVGVAQARVETVGLSGSVYGPLGNFLHEHRPATVVPTPTADDWIDPAVRLPEVGEWYWYPYGDGTVGVDRGGRYDDYHTNWRWAPILVGPPPIPDASEVQDDQTATDGRAPVTRSELRNSGRAYLLELPEAEFWAHRYLIEGDE